VSWQFPSPIDPLHFTEITETLGSHVVFIKIKKFFMKRIFTFLFGLFLLSSEQGFSQADSCRLLGCAAAYGTLTTDNALPFLAGGFPGSCYSVATYKQIFWQFLYVDPAAGVLQNYEQAFTPTNGNGLDIDWAVYDMGTTAPVSLSCPIDHSAWNEIRCSGAEGDGVPAGPGIDPPVLPLVGGRYYAIAIIINPGDADPAPDPNFTFTVGTPTLDGNALAPINCPPILFALPVKLTSFDAKVLNCAVNLDWTSTTETDFKNYEIEYSTDGSNFTTIGTKASNTSDQRYSFQHSPTTQGKAYYRLKMVNSDGSFEYSKTISMKLNCSKTQILIYPNPVKDILNINITNAQDNVTRASLFDNNGKLIHSVQLVSGTNNIDMTRFAKGMYMLTLKNSNGIQNIKIIK
jgi:hypothetical protein